MLRVKIDKTKCIGCGTCVEICPEVFGLGDDGKAKFKLTADSQKLKAKIKEAAESCPVQAINIEI